MRSHPLARSLGSTGCA
uniref:Uncharacterized protein n=1 Tax=Rhizophora mucronata TaxID=61149 RepID=A0A2P2QSW0_RHIMU